MTGHRILSLALTALRLAGVACGSLAGAPGR